MILTSTGIHIGCKYTPPNYVHHDRDAIRIQNILLGKKPRIDWDGIVIAIVMIAFIIYFIGK